MSDFHIWQLLAGLGIFLFGMQQMEQGLKGLTSNSLKTFLREQTRNPFMGVMAGTVATAIMQSSSVVGLIVLAFVGAGILQLKHALGIIFGSNLGTTFTGWIVALIGFKLDLDALALPLLALGSLTYVSFRAGSRTNLVGSLIFGVGLLLFGLGNMKSSVEVLASVADVRAIADFSLVSFLMIGVLFTAVIQSSSATMIIVLSALNGGIIEIHAAAALVIGADLGTTSTLLLGGMKGSAEKKRVAIAHLLFNLITDLLAFALLYPLLAFLQGVVGLSDPLFVLVGFHSSFNLLGICLFLPFIRWLSEFLNNLFKQPEHIACVFIPRVDEHLTEDTMEAACQAADNEVRRLQLKILLFLVRSFKLKESHLLPEKYLQRYEIDGEQAHHLYEEDYSELKEIEGELMAYIYRVQNFTSHPEQSAYLSQLHHTVRVSVFAAKNIKDLRQDLMEFRHTDNALTLVIHDELVKDVKNFIHELVQLNAVESDLLFQEKYTELQTSVKQRYEARNQEIFNNEQVTLMSDMQLSTLAHVNRTALTAMQDLLDAEKIFAPVQQTLFARV